MRYGLILGILSAGIFAAALLTGPPSFDATDGAEFAVTGSLLETAHAPGYPLFLMLLRTVSMAVSPLYGHLRLVNCFLGALLIPLAAAVFGKNGISPAASVLTSVLLVTAAPVMAQLNSLEVYPLAMALALGALFFRGTRLSPYASGMAIFAGHPVSILSAPLMIKGSWWRKPLALTFLIPLTLYLYVPVRALSSRVAHYGHPASMGGFVEYMTMYSGRLEAPSLHRLLEALSFLGWVTGAVLLLLAAAERKFRPGRDVPVLLALLFLASYELPDPAGQLWILLIPLSLRCASGLDRLTLGRRGFLWAAAITVAMSAFTGIGGADRRTDDAAMRWTVDVMSRLPAGSIYRPSAHDTYYAAYAREILGIRRDVVLSDPFGNYFELLIPPPIPPIIGDRQVALSRGWERLDDFRLNGLFFIPISRSAPSPDWENMEIYRFTGTSPDPMALDMVAEAWARRMAQTEEPLLRDSFCRRAKEFAATELTGRRVEILEDM